MALARGYLLKLTHCPMFCMYKAPFITFSRQLDCNPLCYYFTLLVHFVYLLGGENVLAPFLSPSVCTWPGLGSTWAF